MFCWQQKCCALYLSFGLFTWDSEKLEYLNIAEIQNLHIRDGIWENMQYVAQGNFAEINKINLKLLCFSLYFINFYNM